MSLTITVNHNGDVTYADADTGFTCVFQTTESWYSSNGFAAALRQVPMTAIGYMRMDGGGDVLPPPAPAPIETGRRAIVVRD